MDMFNLYVIESMHGLHNRKEHLRQMEHLYTIQHEVRRARRDRREKIWKLLRPRPRPRPSGVVAGELGRPVDSTASCA